MFNIAFDIVRGVVLGAIQGFAEFFPVSSSGHLILVPILFGWPDQGLDFDVIMHLGTLAALLWFFRKELISLAVRFFQSSSTGRDARIFVAKLVVATVPAVILALLFRDLIESVFRTGNLVALNLAFWGLILLWADRSSKKSNQDTEASDVENISWKQAMIVGFAQPIALVPGTSRSGITITAGLFSGLSRSSAARFSFLLSIPVTAGAGLSGILDVVQQGSVSTGILSLVVGFLFATLCGLFAIRFLLSYVAKRSYGPFVAYRLALALVVLVLV
jgi:undecaprenyl-diphosphatase